jgi:opacity protein-like surface antigen
VKKMLFAVVLIAALIPMALAQDVRISGQPLHVTMSGQVGHRTLGDVQAPAGLKKIYSNLGVKTASYDNTNGWLILGPNSAFGQEQWVGFPFTPKKASTATQLKAALGYFDSGVNGVNVSINKDASGVPGKAMAQKGVSNLKEWTDPCCDAIKTIKIKATKLSKKQYWVVVGTNKNQLDSEGVWFFAAGDPTGNQAYSFDGGVTWATEQVQASAFAVYGTQP